MVVVERALGEAVIDSIEIFELWLESELELEDELELQEELELVLELE